MNKPIPGSLRTLCALGLSIGALQTTSLGQGCVAARGAGGLCHPPISPYEFDATATPAHTDGKGKGMIEPTIDESRFRVSLGYRWLYSDRHFRGNNEQRHRDEEGSSVVNNSHYLSKKF